MNTLFFSVLFLSWVAGWLVFVLRDSQSETSKLKFLSQAVPAFTAMTVLAVCTLCPIGSMLPRILHHFGFGMLGVFLLFAEYSRGESRKQLRRDPVQQEELIRSTSQFYTASLLLAPASAVTILITGLRMIHDAPKLVSLAVPWLLIDFLLFSLLMWHGIFGWTQEVERRFQSAKAWKSQENRRAISTIRSEAMFTVHSFMYVVIFALAFTHRPSKPRLVFFDKIFTFVQVSDRMRAVMTALLVWLIVGTIVFVVCTVERGFRRRV